MIPILSIAIFAAASQVPRSACENLAVQVSRAAITLYSDPDARALGEEAFPVVTLQDFLRSTNGIPQCDVRLIRALADFPVPEIALGSLPPAGEQPDRFAGVRQTLAKRGALKSARACRQNSKLASGTGCTPYAAEQAMWERASLSVLKMGSQTSKLQASDANYWRERAGLLDEWNLLVEERSRPNAISEALRRPTLRDWVLDRIFEDPDPRKWDVDSVARAFIAAHETDDQEARSEEARRKGLGGAGVVEIVNDGNAGDEAPRTFNFLRRAMRMGLANAVTLLSPRSLQIPGLKAPILSDRGKRLIGITSSPTWEHVPFELVAYAADWERLSDAERKAFESREIYIEDRWLALDEKAAAPNLAAIRKRISELEK